MRVLVKETLGRSLVGTLADDLAQACARSTRRAACTTATARVKTGIGY